MQELESALQKMKAGKAPGHDEFTSEILKLLNESYKKEFLCMISHMKKGKQVYQKTGHKE